MKTKPSPYEVPEVIGVRAEPDVAIMLQRAREKHIGKSWAQVYNRCARTVLTPMFGTKAIRNLQEKLGLTEKTVK